MKNNAVFSSKNQSLCEHVMNEFLLLDKGEALPLKLSLHIIGCKKCRTEVRYLSLAEKVAAKKLKAAPENIKPVTMTQWVVCGILMTLMLLFFGVFSQNRSPALQIGFYLVFAVVLCSYCALFVAKNLDYFLKKFDSTSPTLKSALSALS